MIIVTGAAGFIGSHIAKELIHEHSLMLVDTPAFFLERRYFDLPQAQPIDFATEKFPEEKHKFVDKEYFLKVLSKIHSLPPADQPNAKEHVLIPHGERIECVIHMGACTDTGETNWDYLTKENIEYTQAIWRWCTKQKVPLIYASSGATYGNGDEGFSDHVELIPSLKPLNLYGRSKQDFDLWALEEARQGRTPPHWYGLKFFNVYGPHEGHKGRMASSILHSYRQVRETGRCKLFRSHKTGVKDGEQRRDFIYIDDIVAIVDFLRTKSPTSGIYNCGTGKSRTFLDMAHALFLALGLPPAIDWIDTPEKYRKAYQYYTEAEMERLHALGFPVKFTSLEDGVAKYVGWLLEQEEKLSGSHSRDANPTYH